MIKDWFSKIELKHVLILFLIFLTAIAIRGHTLRYDYMFEPDAFWHGRMVGEWLETGHIPEYDFQGSYHNANKLPIYINQYFFTWLFGYVGYKLFTFGASYNQETWIWVLRILPLIFGALTSLAVYLIFKWAYNSKNIGYIAGFITAIMPAYVYRTFGGHFEPDSLGFLWMALGVAFLVKAIKEPKLNKENIIYSTLSALMFGIMAFSWQAFVIVPVIIEAYFIFTLLVALYKGVDKKIIKSFVYIFLICFVLTAILGSIAIGSRWVDLQAKYGKGLLGIKDGASIDNSGSGVGEENTGHQFFGTKYGVFNIFLILGIIAGLYALYRQKNDFVTFLLLFIGLVTFYLAWNKLKATYYFGFGLSILTSLAIAEGIEYVKNKDLSIKIMAVLTGLLLITGGVASSIVFAENTSVDISNSWKDTLTWLRFNTPENAKVFNWWNYGHWISFISHKSVSTDNGNNDVQANTDYAAFIIDENITRALGIIKAYNPDYVVIPSDDFVNQSYFASITYNTNMQDYRVQEKLGFGLDCQKSVNQVSGSSEYNCRGNKISASQMDSYQTTWTDKPTDLYQSRVPLYYYTNKQKNMLWALGMSVNNSMGAKLWFNSKDVSPYFDLVYDNGDIKVWKVNKEAFSSIEPHMTNMTREQVDEWNSKLWWLNDSNTMNASNN